MRGRGSDLLEFISADIASIAVVNTLEHIFKCNVVTSVICRHDYVVIILQSSFADMQS